MLLLFLGKMSERRSTLQHSALHRLIRPIYREIRTYCRGQCCGSVTFWYGSEFAVLINPDPESDPDLVFLSVADKMPTKKKFQIFCLITFEGTFFSVFIDKKSKKGKKIVEIKVFLTFCLLTEGSGSRSGSVQNNDGSGSWRPNIHGYFRGLLPQQ